MLGQTNLDLARTLANEHLSGDYDHRSEANNKLEDSHINAQLAWHLAHTHW